MLSPGYAGETRADRPSAPGGGWFVMDTFDIHGGPGGALALTLGYARNSVSVVGGVGTHHLMLT